MINRYLLSLLPLLGTAAQAQVTLSILEPASVEGCYENTWASPANGWTTPDMTLPASLLIDTIALGFDATAADSLCCDASVDPSVAGKIALIYRGTCNFSVKALNCQNAGAVAVIIIQNQPVAPFTMGAGTAGASVTIPVFMMRQDDGAALRAAVEGGSPVVALLGNKSGYFLHDAGMQNNSALIPPSALQPSWLAQNGSEYNFKVGSWVYNYGQSVEADVRLNAVLDNGTVLYDETSTSIQLVPGDSAFIPLPDVNLASYGGDYDLTYTVLADVGEGALCDNNYATTLKVDSIFGYGPWDNTNDRPLISTGIQPGTPAGEFKSCAHFRDANASRVAARGFHLYATVNAPASLDGELLSLYVYKWEDVFTGISDAAIAFNTLTEEENTLYVISEDTNLWRGYVELEDPVVLEDNMRYLFCVGTGTPTFLGYNENLSYAVNETATEGYDQPTTPNANGTTWYLGFVGDPVAAVAVQMIESTSIGVGEQAAAEVGTHPNPSTGLFQVTLGTTELPADITIRDATGRTVLRQQVTSPTAILDLSREAKGVYTVDVSTPRTKATGKLVIQ